MTETETTDRETVLELTTEVRPADLIKIDGEEYKLYSFDHLSPDDEAQVTSIFARFQKIFLNLNEARSDKHAADQARQMRVYRERLITKMTSIPEETVKQLPVGVQGALLKAIRSEITDEEEGYEDLED